MSSHPVLNAVKQVVFPTRERLLAKIADLNERIDLIEEARSQEVDLIAAGLSQEIDLIAAGGGLPLTNPSHGQAIALLEAGVANSTLLRNCRENVKKAEECIDVRRVFSDPHLAWRYLHHDDEDLILVMPLDELRARAVDVKALFKLNIKEEAVRAEWLGGEGGEKGSLSKAVEKLHDPAATAKEVAACRHVVRHALRQVDEQVDRGYWTLSANVFTSVVSAVLLGGLMLAFWRFGFLAMVPHLGEPWKTAPGDWPTAWLMGFAAMVLLGAMGAYLSNFLTTKDFLFVRGGPFLRYLLSSVLARPIVGAFAAAFVFLIEQSGLFFTLGTSADALVTFKLPAEARGFAFAILAIVSGFAADKVLLGMIGSVQKRLMETAEKTMDTPKATASAG